MPLDAICLRAVTNELNNVLAGCRVEKVYQPGIRIEDMTMIVWSA